MSRRVKGDAQPGHGRQSPAYDGRRPRDAAPAPLRTRGPFRPLDCVRGSDGGPAPTFCISDLVGELRAHVFGLPLTFILHGWGGESAEEFLRLLRPSLYGDDALWLLPVGGADLSTHTYEGSVILDMAQDTDRRIYNNLVPDLVFFPAEQDEEMERIRGFERRAGAIILDGRGLTEEGKARDATSESKGRLLDDAARAHPAVYRWVESHLFVLCTPDRSDERAEPAPESEPPPGPDVDMISQQLKEIAESLVPLPRGLGSSVRRQFRTLIEEVVAQYPAGPEWDKELILQADAKGWPDWTVPCLPSIHVTLSSDEAGRVVAFTWDEVLNCVPHELGYAVEGELCGGRILKVRLEPAAARTAADIAAIFEASLSYWMAIPSASERAFLNVLNDAMLQVEGHLFQEGHAETAERVGERRAALVRDMLSIA